MFDSLSIGVNITVMIANGARETSYVWIVVNITGHNNKKVKGILYIALLRTEYALNLFFNPHKNGPFGAPM